MEPRTAGWCGKEALGTDGGTQFLPLILSPSQQGQESVLVGTETHQVPLSIELGTGAEKLISLGENRKQQLNPVLSSKGIPVSYTVAANGSPLPKGGNIRAELFFLNLNMALKMSCP